MTDELLDLIDAWWIDVHGNLHLVVVGQPREIILLKNRVPDAWENM